MHPTQAPARPAGEVVAVESYGRWWAATVIEVVDAGRLRIRYHHAGPDRWWSNREEIVPLTRVQPLHAVAVYEPYRATLVRVLMLLVACGVLIGGVLATRPYWDGGKTSQEATRVLDKGDRVQILWRGDWHPGRVIERRRDEFLVSYDGYDESWNEVVAADRLRAR